jgi:cell shape-determining protein MreD
MMQVALSLFLLVVITVVQPSFRSWIPVVDFVPALMTFWSCRLGQWQLVALMCLGGLLHDFLRTDSLGSGLFIWIFLMFIVRSQVLWINLYGRLFGIVVSFAISFLYFYLDYLAYLGAHRIWVWHESLSLHILLASVLNAGLFPLIHTALQQFYPLQKDDRAPRPLELIHARS